MTLEELKKEIRPLDETSMEQAREHWIKIAKPLFLWEAGGCSDTDGGDQRDPGL